LLFKKRHLPLIISGRKTLAIVRWKKPTVKVGGIYHIRTAFNEKNSHKIRVIGIHRELLGNVTEEEALREGYSSLEEFKKKWRKTKGCWNPRMEVSIVEFEYAGES